MPEGLSPIEAGKSHYEHGAALREPGEEEAGQDESAAGHGKSSDHHTRIAQIGEAVLLALVTLAAAWTGYAAARWSTASGNDVAQSSVLGNLATRDALTAVSLRNFDSTTFNAWFVAFTLNSPQKEAVAERRFRPEFEVAFKAWLATDPLHNPHSPPGPTYMPQYKLAAQTQADALDKEAAVKSGEGDHAGQVSDDYVRITVFLAAVLFLVGIGTSFKLNSVRFALIAFGSVLLFLSVVAILRQPGLPS
jgi:hypothetical protein